MHTIVPIDNVIGNKIIQLFRNNRIAIYVLIACILRYNYVRFKEWQYVFLMSFFILIESKLYAL